MVDLFTGNDFSGVWMGLIAVFVALFGVLIIAQYLQSKRDVRTSSLWQSIEGKITMQRIREEENYDEDGANILYIPEVIYTYLVGGILYENKRIDFGSSPRFVNRKKAESFMEPYQVESNITVYYNPDNPQDAVLSQSVQRMKGRLITGLVMIAIAAYLIIRVIQR